VAKACSSIVVYDEALDTRSFGNQRWETSAAHVTKIWLIAVQLPQSSERGLAMERTQAGLSRAEAQGKALGRPSSLKAGKQQTIRAARATGWSLGVLAIQYGASRAAIQRIEKKVESDKALTGPAFR
jgi:hypothetical protein